MDEENRPVYCPRCGSIAQAGDRFCGVCGATISPDAQDAAPTQEIPTVVQPPPSVPVRRGNRTLAVVIGLGALLFSMLAIGAIVGFDLLGGETAGGDGPEPKPAATTPSVENSQDTPAQDEGPQTLSVGDSVEARGVKTTLNAVRILPTTDTDQPIESPDNLFVATDLTFENTSDESVAVSDLYEFVLQNEDGYSASQTTHTQQRPLLAEGEIEPGGKSSGDLVYEVPPESKGLQLDYAPFSGEKTYTWQVGDASEIPGAEESTSSEENQTEADLVEAVEDYYQAVDREDWGYTYQNLDSQTQAAFDEEEWYLKNQWFADNESLELATMDVTVNDTASDPVVGVSIYRAFKDGTSIDRDTFFVYEDNNWKHRFGEEEIWFFMPDVSFEEFVAAQGGSSPSPSASAAPTGEEDAEVEDAVRGHYEAIGRGDFEEAYSYFGPTMRSRQDEASWVASEQTYEIQSSTIQWLTVDEVLGSTATATVDVSFVDNTGTPRFVIMWGLLKEDGEWRLDEQISAQTATSYSASPPATQTASPSATPSASPESDQGSGGGDRKRRLGSDSLAEGRDVDCDEVDGPIWVGSEDPNNLDGDGDGWGCE
jgi:hypothetical protein